MRVIRIGCIALLVAALLAKVCVAQKVPDEPARKIDALFAAYDKTDSPGCALGVVQNGAFVYEKGYGMGSLELGVPLTPQSVFYMGSVSKQFTAASVVLAAEQGFLSLDDDIRKYVPEIPAYEKPVTLREMLHHTSGLRDILGLLALSGRNFEDIHPTPELLDLLSRQKALNFAPNEEYLYSNTNYFLMSVVIRRATGKPLSTFAEDNIFKPLGMTHTRFYDDHSVIVAGRVPAYEPRDGGGFRIDWSTNFDKIGDGGLLSSVDDLLLWDRNFYDNKLGKGALLKELQTKAVLNNGKSIEYALGLEISQYRGLPIVEHGGALFGYRTSLLRFPEQKFSVICLCNLGSSNPGRLAEQVADIYLEAQLAPESKKETATGAQPVPRGLDGSYREAETHAVYKVTRDGDELVLVGEHLRPVGPGRYTVGGNIAVQFDSPAGGEPRFTISPPDGQPRTFQRIQPVTPTAAELAQYAGEYQSSELQATYKFDVKDEKLTLSVGWQEPVSLEPSVRDEFEGSSGRAFVFRRDAAGHITGCDLFAGRVRDISFKRVAP
jgi:CubicO group peptidase (beta-lactamase class C family)